MSSKYNKPLRSSNNLPFKKKNHILNYESPRTPNKHTPQKRKTFTPRKSPPRKIKILFNEKDKKVNAKKAPNYLNEEKV